MKIIKTEATDSKTASLIDLGDELNGLTKAQKKEVLTDIGELLVGQILEACADSKSPVTGRAFHKLSKEYAKKKQAEVGSKDPNLDLNGEMLDALDFKIVGDKIDLGVFGSDAPKADGHNNFSGKSKLPERRFLPGEGQGFTSDIDELISDTIKAYRADNLSLDDSKLKVIESKADLYEYLRSVIGDFSRAEIRGLVLQSELAAELDAFDLLDLL